MGTLKRLEEMKERHARENAAMESELKIAVLVPDDARIHVHKLYGSIASVKFGTKYTNVEEHCSWERAHALVMQFPPVAQTLNQGGFTSFKPRAYVESLSEEKRNREGSETDVSPVRLRIDYVHNPSSYTPVLSLEWWTMTPEGLVGVEVVMGRLPPSILVLEVSGTRVEGGHTVHFNRDTSRGSGEFSWTRTCNVSLRLDQEAYTLQDNGESLVEYMSPIRWASGGSSYPGTFTVYWIDLDSDLDPARVGEVIVRNLARLAQVAK